jgi:hypothetical protein
MESFASMYITQTYTANQSIELLTRVCHYVVGEVPIRVCSPEGGIRVCSPEGGIHECVLLREGHLRGMSPKGVPKPQENARVLEPPFTCKTSLFLLGPAPTETGTNIALDPTFGSFYLIRTSLTSSEPVSLMKVFRPFRLEWIVSVFRVWTQLVDVQHHLIYWQGQCVCDALF